MPVSAVSAAVAAHSRATGGSSEIARDLKTLNYANTQNLKTATALLVQSGHFPPLSLNGYGYSAGPVADNNSVTAIVVPDAFFDALELTAPNQLIGQEHLQGGFAVMVATATVNALNAEHSLDQPLS